MTIDKQKLLIVEGDDEENIFNHWYKKLNIEDVQVISIGGKNNLTDKLDTLKLLEKFISVTHIAIIIDADNSEASSFQSVCSALRVLSVSPPNSQLNFSTSSPKVKVLIACGENSKGSIEDYFLNSIKETDTYKCIEQYFECIDNSSEETVDAQKLIIPKTYSYLASNPQTARLKLGISVMRGFWNLDHSSFDTLRNFISQW